MLCGSEGWRLTRILNGIMLDAIRVYCVTENGTRLKSFKFTSGIFHFIFSILIFLCNLCFDFFLVKGLSILLIFIEN